MFHNKRDYHDQALRDSETIRVDAATLHPPHGPDSPGVVIFSDDRVRVVLDLPAAYRLASALVDTLQQQKETAA